MLRVDIRGQGHDLVMLHGWALHGGVFDAITADLAQRFRVHLIDLPGHGHNAHIEMPADIDRLAGLVLASAPPRAHWLGWSLGGMVSLAAAGLAPERVERLVLVASSPRFVANDEWPHAVTAENLARMAADLDSDFHRTVENFLALQVLGDERANALLRLLRETAFAHGELQPASLANGLNILRDADLRPGLAALRSPLLAIMGSRDRLTPPAAGKAMAEMARAGRAHVIAKAAHMPFVSHREEFLEVLGGFLSHE